MPTYRSPRAASALAAIICLLAAACAPDEPFHPGSPRAGGPRRALGDSGAVADSLVADSGAVADSVEAPPDTSVARPAELDSLYGDAAEGLFVAIERHRATAAGAADAAARRAADDLAWPADTEAVGDPNGAGIVAAARASRARAPRAPRLARSPGGGVAPVVTREDFVQGNTAYRLDVRTTVTPSSDPKAGTLTVMTEELSTIVPTRGRGNAVREETIVTVTVPACPSDEGLVPARVATSVRAWRGYGYPANAKAPDDALWDRRRESVLEGEVTTRVGDDAEVSGYDMDLFSRVTYDLDATSKLEGTARFVAGDQSASRLYDPLGTRVPTATSGDRDALATLGLDERLVWPETRRAIARQVAAARSLWRGGYCVQLIAVSRPASGQVEPNTLVAITPTLSMKRDGATVDRWFSTADALGTSFNPSTQKPHVFPYMFAMPKNGVRVEISGTSRRGIPDPVSFNYVNPTAGADSGWMEYAAESRFTVNHRGKYETVTGGASGWERVRTRLRLEYDHTLNDDVYYKVEAVHEIDMGGDASLTTNASGPGAGTFIGRMGATLGGRGVTHSPRDTTDQPLVQGRWIAPYLGTPTQDLGTLRIYRAGGAWRYEMFLRTGQIAPKLSISRYTQGPCFPDNQWSVDEGYSNDTFTITEKLTDPGKCLDRRPATTTFRAPYTYGAISIDQGKYRFLAGPVEVNDGRVTIDARIQDYTTDCETARLYDPLQMATLLMLNDVSRDSEWQLGRDGVCRFSYDLQWHLDVPPRRAP